VQIAKSEMEAAVAEARHFIALYEEGLIREKFPGELNTWRDALRAREAALRGERVRQSDLENAEMFTRLQAVRYFRSNRCMNHSPLRQIEREWLEQLFAPLERVSKLRITIEFDIGESNTEQVGGHINGYGRYFRCTRCPDSRKGNR